MSNCTHCNDTKRIPLFMPGSFAPCDWCATVAPVASVDEEEEDLSWRMTINGDVCETSDFTALGNGGFEVSTDEGRFIVFETQEDAGKAARAYWADMAANDPSEFACMVGEKSLIAWGMGHYGGPGSTQTKSLSDWLDLHLDVPEEQFASYDSNEREVTDAGDEVLDQLGFTPAVAYRC